MKKTFSAGNGKPGSGKKKFGSDGKDLILEVPIGTLIYDESGSLVMDMNQPDYLFLAAKGGKGGKGNSHFSTSTNQTPYYAQQGLPGDEVTLRMELKLIAQVGLIGLPNAGKSTLLKKVTAASPRIGAYPFTTLYPNLGTLKFSDQEIILADIPGLIEGASDGKGLGNEFLRHVDRTRILIHLISVEDSEKDPWDDFECIVSELKKSAYDLLKKPRLVVLSKSDTVNEERLLTIKQVFESRGIHPLCISAATSFGIDALINQIRELASKPT